MCLRVAFIGLGHQNVNDHLPAALQSDLFEVVALCDLSAEALSSYSENLGIPGYTCVDRMLAEKAIDVAIVAIPHNAYHHVIDRLIRHHVHVIKEKPFAVTLDEARYLYNLAQEHKVFIGVTMQRRFNPIYQAFHQLRRRIGKVFLVEGQYGMNISRLDDGWRAHLEVAGGGALIDMGYHFIDLLIWYFGMPKSVSAKCVSGNRPGQYYNVEDTVLLLMDYSFGRGDLDAICNVTISRVYPQKIERLVVFGTKGRIEIERGEISRFDEAGQKIETLLRTGGWQSAAVDQLEYFANIIKCGSEYFEYQDHLKHVAIIESAYKSHANSSTEVLLYNALDIMGG